MQAWQVHLQRRSVLLWAASVDVVACCGWPDGGLAGAVLGSPRGCRHWVHLLDRGQLRYVQRLHAHFWYGLAGSGDTNGEIL